MNEKEMFLDSYEREYEITLKFLNAFPAEQFDFHPQPDLQSALEIAWSFPEEERILISAALDNSAVFKKNPPPGTFDEVKTAYQANHHMFVTRIKELADTSLSEIITFTPDPDHASSMQRADALWLMLMDGAHHRGQFSVYIRMVGAKVPSLYNEAIVEEKK